MQSKASLVLLSLIAISMPMKTLLAEDVEAAQTPKEVEKAQPVVEAPEAVKKEQISKAAATTTNTAPAVKSAFSQSLENRLGVGLSLGFVTIPKAKEGEYLAFSGVDLSIQWVLMRSEISVLKTNFRYLPIEAENRVDGASYDSILEAFFLGGIYEWAYSQTVSLLAGAELGYIVVHTKKQDRQEVSDKSEANKFAYGVTTGLDWAAMEKLKLGPRINVAFGDMQIAQYAAALTFIF